MTQRNGAHAADGDTPKPVNRFADGPFDKERFLQHNTPWGRVTPDIEVAPADSQQQPRQT